MAHPNFASSNSDLPTQAAEWVEKISQEDGEQYAAAAEEWCARSSEHRREFMLAAITNIQFEALRGQPYSLGLKGYCAPLHRWMVAHLTDSASLEHLAEEVHARFSQQRVERPDERITALVYSIASELTPADMAAPSSEPHSLTHLFESAIRELPGKWRDALLLCSRDHWTPEEAANALGLSVTTVKRYLARARTVVAAKLSSTGFS